MADSCQLSLLILKDEKKCKILGFIYSFDGTQLANFNNTLRKGWLNLRRLQNLTDVTTPAVRGILAHAYIFSHLIIFSLLFY